jgi:hypothetical protein
VEHNLLATHLLQQRQHNQKQAGEAGFQHTDLTSNIAAADHGQLV